MRDIRFNRERFLKGNSYYAKKGISAQPSQLLVESEITNKDVIRFELNKEIKQMYERTLKRNDLFVVRAIGVALRIKGNKEVSPLYSYPVQLIEEKNGKSGVAGFHKPGKSFRMYDGYLSMKTGQVTNFSSFPMLNFLHIPREQPQRLGTKDDYFSNGIVPACNPSDFMYELPEEIVLAGTQDHKIQIEFPQEGFDPLNYQDSKGDAAILYATLIFQGWLYEGATGQEYKDDPANPYRLSI